MSGIHSDIIVNILSWLGEKLCQYLTAKYNKTRLRTVDLYSIFNQDSRCSNKCIDNDNDQQPMAMAYDECCDYIMLSP